METKVILVDASKEPLNGLMSDGHWDALESKMRSTYKLVSNRKDEYTRELLSNVSGVILGAPRQALRKDEIVALQQFMFDGGSVLVMTSEGTEGESFAHLNQLTERHGIVINNDSVVRSVYRRGYYHPKEAYVKDVTLMKAIDMVSGKDKQAKSKFDLDADPYDDTKLNVVYPFGCSLNVRLPALPMLSSGPLCYPQNRALCAIANVGEGRLIVCGSCHIFEDQYIQKEDNMMLATALFKYLVDGKAPVEKVDPDRPEFGERVEIPDTEALSERLRTCLQESEEIPTDWVTMFDLSLFEFNSKLIPEVLGLYDKLNVKHETLSFIVPQFEVPLPPLQPAIFFPLLRQLPSPTLDLFDLDEKFASEKLRLAQLTNRCADEDLEYYVRESGEILGISDDIRISREARSQFSDKSDEKEKKKQVVTAKEVLHHVLQKLVHFKFLDQEGGMGQSFSGMGQSFSRNNDDSMERKNLNNSFS
jgi:intraflagellar transport protein 52